MQISEEIKTENVAAVGHALLNEKRKTARLSLSGKAFFQALNRDKNFKKKCCGTVRYKHGAKFEPYAVIKNIF